MVVEYVALFKKEENQYRVSFPDIPDAVTKGDTLEIAKHNAIECLKISLLNKVDLPDSSNFDVLETKYPNYVLSLIQVEV